MCSDRTLHNIEQSTYLQRPHPNIALTGAWNAKCPIFLSNFTPKTSNYCLKNSALGFPGDLVGEQTYQVNATHIHGRLHFSHWINESPTPIPLGPGSHKNYIA